jgi:4-hydroxythreonine-4-phosphate dehydrogenase
MQAVAYLHGLNYWGMQSDLYKPIIGFSCGDINGIGIEVLIQALHDNRVLDMCTPVIFASNKSINFYRKTLPDVNFSYSATKDITRLNPKQVNIFNCWEEEVSITPGVLNETGGKYALTSLEQAVSCLQNGDIDALVTAPIHKKNVYSERFPYSGHTPYLKASFEAKDVLMFMVASNIRVGLLTEHVPVHQVHEHVTKDNIIRKLQMMHSSLRRDFGINTPKIAVLGLNPHAGDEGLIGEEEQRIILPAIEEARKQMLVFGAFSADAFFARAQYEQFDAVLAMYHDQGLIPFKSLAIGEGTNFTAGLPVVRTSPDHGTAFDIAGKGKASAASTLSATFEAIDIVRRRRTFDEAHSNPIQRRSNRLLQHAVDEKIDE